MIRLGSGGVISSALDFLLKSSTPEDRQLLLEALEEFCRAHKLSVEVMQAVDLSLEEHLANILSYGRHPFDKATILIRFSIENNEISVEVHDAGIPFDPTSHPAPDLAFPLDERPVGGLGIHLMRQFMDRLEYRREEGRNVLIMHKNLDTAQ